MHPPVIVRRALSSSGTIYPQSVKAVARIVFGTDARVAVPPANDVAFGSGISGYVVMTVRMHGATLLAALRNPAFPNVGKQKK
jgi:hypothetical protein